MRILIHSNAPWVPTGYGLQTRYLMEQLRGHGHKVAVSAFSGAGGADLDWRGYKIMPSGQMAFGVDMLIPHMRRWEPDVTILLMDLRMLAGLPGAVLKEHNLVAWLPVDCYPMSRPDRAVLISAGIKPVAMSRFGESQIAAELGGSAHVRYAPHATDSTRYLPMDDRREFRRELEVDDQFVIGICAANKDSLRKAWPEQFEAFRQFRIKRPNSVLLVHTTPRNVGGLDLVELASDLDIIDAVRFSDQYAQDSGLVDSEMMRRWYSALDVLSLCSYGEGFGVPLIEAQACGTPVITSHGSAMSELVGPGWLVDTTPFWNPTHRAWWRRPTVDSIVSKYRAAYRAIVEESDKENRRGRAREFAIPFDVGRVFNAHWAPILKEME